jgi:hypothetical protein
VWCVVSVVIVSRVIDGDVWVSCSHSLSTIMLMLALNRRSHRELPARVASVAWARGLAVAVGAGVDGYLQPVQRASPSPVRCGDAVTVPRTARRGRAVRAGVAEQS